MRFYKWKVNRPSQVTATVRPLWTLLYEISKLMDAEQDSQPEDKQSPSSNTDRRRLLWILTSYTMPFVVSATMLTSSGWYGTGTSGQVQGILRFVAFAFGIYSAFHVSIVGSRSQKIAVLPAVIGYTAILGGILYDNHL